MTSKNLSYILFHKNKDKKAILFLKMLLDIAFWCIISAVFTILVSQFFLKNNRLRYPNYSYNLKILVSDLCFMLVVKILLVSLIQAFFYYKIVESFKEHRFYFNQIFADEGHVKRKILNKKTVKEINSDLDGMALISVLFILAEVFFKKIIQLIYLFSKPIYSHPSIKFIYFSYLILVHFIFLYIKIFERNAIKELLQKEDDKGNDKKLKTRSFATINKLKNFVSWLLPKEFNKLINNKFIDLIIILLSSIFLFLIIKKLCILANLCFNLRIPFFWSESISQATNIDNKLFFSLLFIQYFIVFSFEKFFSSKEIYGKGYSLEILDEKKMQNLLICFINAFIFSIAISNYDDILYFIDNYEINTIQDFLKISIFIGLTYFLMNSFLLADFGFELYNIEPLPEVKKEQENGQSLSINAI